MVSAQDFTADSWWMPQDGNTDWFLLGNWSEGVPTAQKSMGFYDKYGTEEVLLEISGISTASNGEDAYSSYAYIYNYYDSSKFAVSVVSGATWQISYDAYLGGENSSGRLSVESGSNVIIGNTLNVGGLDGNTGGNLSISGSGSVLNVGSSATLYSSNSSITVDDGGALKVTNGVLNAGLGLVSVSGLNSSLEAKGLRLNEFSFADQANIASGQTYVLGAGTITDGATWTLTDSLLVGSTGGNVAELTISGGAQVVGASEYAAAIGQNNTQGRVIVTGAGSSWTQTGSLQIGYDALSQGTLQIENGGSVQVTGDIMLATQAGSQGSMSVAQGASLYAQAVAVGKGVSDLTIQGTLTTTVIRREAPTGDTQGARRITFDGATWNLLKLDTYNSTDGQSILGGDGKVSSESAGFLSGEVTLGAGGLTVNTKTTAGEGLKATISADLSGTGGITKDGQGTLWLTGNNTFTGNVRVKEGGLGLVAGALDSSVTLYIEGNGFLDLESGILSVSSVVVNGVELGQGEYTSAMDWITGTGTLQVIPEPSMMMALVLAFPISVILRNRIRKRRFSA
jgi:T5SS/PEP-CTERM-associated repeat protein/autotransporter-associated beta strand protein